MKKEGEGDLGLRVIRLTLPKGMRMQSIATVAPTAAPASPRPGSVRCVCNVLFSHLIFPFAPHSPSLSFLSSSIPSRDKKGLIVAGVTVKRQGRKIMLFKDEGSDQAYVKIILCLFLRKDQTVNKLMWNCFV